MFKFYEEICNEIFSGHLFIIPITVAISLELVLIYELTKTIKSVLKQGERKMLTNEKLNEHYKHFRKFTIKQSGNEIADLEKIIREVFLSHNEALEEIEKLKKLK